MTPADISEDEQPGADAGADARPDKTSPNETGPNETGPNETGPNETGPNETAGRLLYAARMKTERTIEDIATETRVPMRHLRAIESDEHDALPALPYSQGFVRSFATAVGLDADLLAGQFRAETSQRPHVPRMATIEPLDERRLPNRVVVIGSLIGLVVLVAGLSAWGAGVFEQPVLDPPFVEADAPMQAARLSPQPPASSSMLRVDGPANDAATGALDADMVGDIVLTARENVWVRVYDPTSELVPISRVMSAGERFAVPAEPAGLMLWTGKAGALEVRVGDALLPPLGRRTQTLRDIRLTPTALRAQAAQAAPAVAREPAIGAETQSGEGTGGGTAEGTGEDTGAEPGIGSVVSEMGV
jgi:cytoskeletal protein RodZ